MHVSGGLTDQSNLAEANSLSSKLEAKGSKLIPLSTNLVDEVWGSKRPPRPASKVFALDIKYTGRKLPWVNLS